MLNWLNHSGVIKVQTALAFSPLSVGQAEAEALMMSKKEKKMLAKVILDEAEQVQDKTLLEELKESVRVKPLVPRRPTEALPQLELGHGETSLATARTRGRGKIGVHNIFLNPGENQHLLTH